MDSRDLPTGMPPADFLHKLADAAHEAWRQRMLADGWTHGSVYNAEAHIHDALVPFLALDEDDRDTALLNAEGLELEERLAKAVDYPRGPDRPFTRREMKNGLAVEDVADGTRGQIISWTTHPRTGRLELIRVKWPDGEISEHAPAERTLRRVE